MFNFSTLWRHVSTATRMLFVCNFANINSFHARFSSGLHLMTNNSISSPDPLGRPRAQIVFEVFAAALICIASVAGNALVVHVIRRDPRLHSVNNMFVVNLAWSDIFMALGEMPFWIVSLLKGRWVFGRRACYVAVLLQLTFGTASLHTLALIALNRFCFTLLSVISIISTNLIFSYFSLRKFPCGVAV